MCYPQHPIMAAGVKDVIQDRLSVPYDILYIFITVARVYHCNILYQPIIPTDTFFNHLPFHSYFIALKRTVFNKKSDIFFMHQGRHLGQTVCPV